MVSANKKGQAVSISANPLILWWSLRGIIFVIDQGGIHPHTPPWTNTGMTSDISYISHIILNFGLFFSS